MFTLQPLPPPSDPDVAEPVRRHLVSAGVVVVIAGLLFAIVGVFRSPTEGDEVVAQPDAVSSPADDAAGDTADGDVTAAPANDDTVDDTTDSDTSDDAAAPDDETADDTDTVIEPEPEPAATAATTEPAAEPEPSQEADDGRISPSSISVQVLDAVLDDDRQTANEVADRLRAADYRVVATNAAIRTYEKTTVMYTAGFEAQARQIAEEFGFTEVQQKPDNLTDQVQVHLVVGLDAR